MMNTQNVSTLQVFRSICRKCKVPFLQFCPKEFDWFFSESIIILLKVNLQNSKRLQLANFLSKVRLFLLKRVPNNLEARKRHSGCQEKLATNESHYSSNHVSIVLIWSSLFSSQLLCTTTTY